MDDDVPALRSQSRVGAGAARRPDSDWDLTLGSLPRFPSRNPSITPVFLSPPSLHLLNTSPFVTSLPPPGGCDHLHFPVFVAPSQSSALKCSGFFSLFLPEFGSQTGFSLLLCVCMCVLVSVSSLCLC